MDKGTILTILIICVVVFSIFAYLFFMVFFPEWVGITGKKAKEIQQSHVGDKSETQEKK
ncbi:MAG TPA: hypothetical protein VM432_05865 [Bdellovibrionales bacterium]|jgi:hypothetical protein|nr:hypothetical protein [Bdellovibrionales bacterium]